MKNRTMLQGFEWNLPEDSKHWNLIGEKADELAKLGFTDVWLPPAYKGIGGAGDVGYGVYDLYDLGEFDQKGSVPTKYGTLEQYIQAVRALHDAGLGVLADIVLNHKMGADFVERVLAEMYYPEHRKTGYKLTKKIGAQTHFTFPGRRMVHSDFEWNHTHFTGVDINEDNEYPGSPMNGGIRAVYKLVPNRWSLNVDKENENYDYLMGADVNFANPEVREELKRWAKWYVDMVGFDGVRIDAVKHIDHHYFNEWLAELRAYTGKEFFAVGEYWNGNVDLLDGYLHNSGKCMSLFDVSLHYNLWNASNQGSEYDLRTIFDNTLVQREPWYAVTFVDNHDTQPGQMLESWVADWFKPLAYALILLRRDGFPCVFYGDLYGTRPYSKWFENPVTKQFEEYPGRAVAPCQDLQTLLLARARYAVGGQKDYFEDANLIGWTREGGMAVVMSNKSGGAIPMKLGMPGQMFVDLTGNDTKPVFIDKNGVGHFRAGANSVSVWVAKE